MNRKNLTDRARNYAAPMEVFAWVRLARSSARSHETWFQRALNANAGRSTPLA
jgi:hypothetical protein